MILGAVAVAIVAALLANKPAQPTPGVLHSRDWVRSFHCEALSADEARARYPGRIPDSRAQGDLERSALRCAQHVLRAGLRTPRDEEILRSLSTFATTAAAAPAAVRPELAARTWLVEGHHSDAQVTSKLVFATQAALVDRGYRVSDRAPVLSATELVAVTEKPPFEAYPEACRTYTANGSLREGDALLALVHLDAHETALHAGICADGRWTWVP